MNKTTTPDNSSVHIRADSGSTWVGPDAIRLLRAIHLKSALALYSKTGMKMTRGATPTFMLHSTTEITGKSYRRGDYAGAIRDLTTWIETMKAAMPITSEPKGGKVKASELSNLAMTMGNEKKYSHVIQGGMVKEWVGIGWIETREATQEDLDKFPTVED